MDVEEEIGNIIQKLQQVHHPPGPVHQEVSKKQAVLNLEKNEMAGIYYLKESHCPGLRSKAVYRLMKNRAGGGDMIGLNKNYIDFTCDKSASFDNINEMLQQVWEMPKEWTLVQITTKSDPIESMQLVSNKAFTNDLYISVFQCGRKQHKPFCVSVPAPVDTISGSVMNIKEEMNSILTDNKEILKPQKQPLNTIIEKNIYHASRLNINNRLKNLVKDVQNYWLGEWRCLLMGKLIGKDEKKVKEVVQAALKDVNEYKATEKVRCILACLARASNHLKLIEIRRVVQYCFPDDREIVRKISRIIDDFSKCKPFFSQLKVHPVILILDEKLDVIPWEMVDVILNHPVTRMPSLHFTYALFKQYEHRIENGLLGKIDVNKGKYIINPDLDLDKMEKRVDSFVRKRLPNWSGLVHVTPQAADMEKSIVESDIFSYHGHGNGSQFLPSEKVQKLSSKSVICLFGCSSSSYIKLGPQIEMYGAHQMYLLASSPCIVGALWTITDIDTDVFSTEFFNLWIPPVKDFNWRNINRKVWETTGKMELTSSKKGDVEKGDIHEPELLRALCKAKKCVSQYLTQAAFIARGLPVTV